jgi:hypothetical protein
LAFSFSSITTFEKCAKKYYHTRVVKDVTDAPGVEATYGTNFHTAAECLVRDDTPMPSQFKAMEPTVLAMKNLPGEKYVELKLAVKRDETGKFAPAGFDDDDAWYRGIIDLLVINGTQGRMIDWKTGKNARYADMRQLDMMAGATFVLFPEVETIKSALIYVVSGELVTKEHIWERMDNYLGTFDGKLLELADAHNTGVWNPSPSPLCAWCPVTECPHWKPRR